METWSFQPANLIEKHCFSTTETLRSKTRHWISMLLKLYYFINCPMLGSSRSRFWIKDLNPSSLLWRCWERTGKWDGKKHKSINLILCSSLSPWATEVWSCWGTLRDTLDYTSEVVQLKGEKLDYLSSNSISHWLSVSLGGINSLEFPTYLPHLWAP